MTAVPATRTWVAGEVVTAAHFNTNIRDVLNYLLTPPILEIRQSVNQNLTNNAFTTFTFTSEDVDSSGMHSTSVNTSRCTAVYPGWYDWGGALSIESNATGNRSTVWTKNGGVVGGVEISTVAMAGFDQTVAMRRKKIFLNVGDYVEAAMFQSSGGTRTSGAATGNPAATLSGSWISN